MSFTPEVAVSPILSSPPGVRPATPREPGAARWRGSRRGSPAVVFTIAILVQLGFMLAFVYRPPALQPVEHAIEVAIMPPTPDRPVERPVMAHPDPTLPHVAIVSPVLPQIRIEMPPPPASAPPAPNAISLPPAPPPPPPSQSSPPVGIEDRFKAAVFSAVLTAHRVPDSARALGIFGETRVGFSLRDTQVSNVRVVASSGHDSLDEAAVRAVRNAAYPEPPLPLRGRLLDFEITLYHRRMST
jgi:protein TonB